jgi:hypothetical protein
MPNWRRWPPGKPASFAFDMPALLHILTRPDDPLAKEIIAQQKASAENKIEVIDLTGSAADYNELLEKIFRADSVQVW